VEALQLQLYIRPIRPFWGAVEKWETPSPGIKAEYVKSLSKEIRVQKVILFGS